MGFCHWPQQGFQSAPWVRSDGAEVQAGEWMGCALKGGSREGRRRLEIEFGDNQKFINWLKLVLMVYFNLKINICSNLTHITILLNIIVLLPWIVLNYFLKNCLLGNVLKWQCFCQEKHTVGDKERNENGCQWGRGRGKAAKGGSSEEKWIEMSKLWNLTGKLDA